MAGLRRPGWWRRLGTLRIAAIMAIGDDLPARLRAIPAPVQGALIMTAAAAVGAVGESVRARP